MRHHKNSCFSVLQELLIFPSEEQPPWTWRCENIPGTRTWRVWKIIQWCALKNICLRLQKYLCCPPTCSPLWQNTIHSQQNWSPSPWLTLYCWQPETENTWVKLLHDVWLSRSYSKLSISDFQKSTQISSGPWQGRNHEHWCMSCLQLVIRPHQDENYYCLTQHRVNRALCCHNLS